MAQVTVTAQYIADTVQYVNNVKRATDATNQFAKSMPQAEQASNRMKASTVGLGAAMGTLGAIVFAKAASAVTNFAQQGIAAAASYEQTVISMQGIFQGSGMSMQQAAKKTESYLAELRDFAARTPFELPQTLDAVKRLLSIGYAADDVKDRLLPAVGDITAALGQPAAAINGVVYAFGQMKSAGRVLSQDLMQIGNALPGFNAKMAIAKELFNGDVGAMTKAMESGSLDSTKAIDAIISAMQKFPGAAGAMERQSKTLNGVISTFKDTVNNALIDGLMPAIPVLSGALEKLVGPVSDLATAFAQALGPALIRIVESAQTFIPVLTDFAVRMLNFVPTLMNVVGLFLKLAPAVAAIIGPLAVVALGFKAYDAASGIIGRLIGVVKALTVAQIKQNIAVMANPYVIVGALIVGALLAVAAAFKWVYDRSEQLRTATAVLIQTIKNIVGVLVNDLLGAWRSITGQTDGATDSSKSLGDVLKTIADVAGGALSKALEFVGNYLKIVANYVRLMIKWWEVLVKIVQMVIGVMKTLIVEGFKKIQPVISWVLDHLGPLGTAFRAVGTAVKNAFSDLPNFLRNVLSGAIGFIESFVNKGIGAINWLIDQYNKLPGVEEIAPIAEFEFTAFGDAAAQVAADAKKAAAIAAEAKRDAVAAARLSAQATGTTTTDTTTTTTTDTGKAKKQADALKKIEEQFKTLQETLMSAADAYRVINDSVNDSNVLFGEQSKIMSAFGAGGDIGSAIAMFDQLDSALRDYEKAIVSAAGKNKQLAETQLATVRQQRGQFKELTQRAVDLFNERKRILADIEKAERDYADAQNRINANYDRLEAAAQKNIDAIEARYADMLPRLEKALEAANALYEKENGVLQDLIGERDKFLEQISTGFRSFLNNLNVGDDTTFRAALTDRLESLREFSANIRTLVSRGLDPTLVREFVSAGVSSAGDLVASLAGAGADEIAAINAQQADLASEISSFQSFANEQWYQAGISQQQAIVAPLQTAAEQAEMALIMAQNSRNVELAAARQHLESLKAARQAELAQAKIDYDNAVAVLKSQLDTNEQNINANAAAIQSIMQALGDPGNPQSLQNILLAVGRAAGDGLIRGLDSKKGPLVRKARELAEAMNRAFRETLQIGSPSKVMRTIGQQVADGLIIGMEQSERSVMRAAQSLAEAAVMPVPMPSIGAPTAGAMYGGAAFATVAATPAASTVINVHVDTGIATDPAETGRRVVEAIRKYERRSGPVFVNA